MSFDEWIEKAKEIALKNDVTEKEFNDGLGYFQDCYEYGDSAFSACMEFRDLVIEQRCKKSIALLRDLYDLQNGSPLATVEKEWSKTMQEITDFFNEIEN